MEKEHMRGKQEDTGFTLVELLIAVAIIGILVAIAIPLFQSYRSKAYNGSAIADLRNIRTGMEAFRTDLGYPGYLLYK